MLHAHNTRKLPDPLPAGQLPAEDSRLWNFVPKSVEQGERWVQEDTRAWFEEQGRLVEVSRHYPTHPRWIVGAAAKTRSGALSNTNIVSEVHILVRVVNNLPDFPAWVATKMSLKMQQADLQYRLTKTARGVFLEQGKRAMQDFAERNPGQFLKFIANTFVPKQIEQNVTVTPGGTLDPEQADAVLAALNTELQRRAAEAAVVRDNPLDFPDGVDPAKTLTLAASEFSAATGHENPKEILGGKPEPHKLTKGLRDVVDLSTAEDIEWD